jgi:hypothetical protein
MYLFRTNSKRLLKRKFNFALHIFQFFQRLCGLRLKMYKLRQTHNIFFISNVM